MFTNQKKKSAVSSSLPDSPQVESSLETTSAPSDIRSGHRFASTPVLPPAPIQRVTPEELVFGDKNLAGEIGSHLEDDKDLVNYSEVNKAARKGTEKERDKRATKRADGEMTNDLFATLSSLENIPDEEDD